MIFLVISRNKIKCECLTRTCPYEIIWWKSSVGRASDFKYNLGTKVWAPRLERFFFFFFFFFSKPYLLNVFYYCLVSFALFVDSSILFSFLHETNLVCLVQSQTTVFFMTNVYRAFRARQGQGIESVVFLFVACLTPESMASGNNLKIRVHWYNVNDNLIVFSDWN